jgi:peptidyl-dipeptidase Dcp
VWEVSNRNGAHSGYWYFDPYARPGKISGAWMSEYRGQERLDHQVFPIVSNNTNFVKGDSGVPTLISWDDAVALFHEFGHALHGLISNVDYPSLAGTNVVRDFVEFPSQLNENWLSPSWSRRSNAPAPSTRVLPPSNTWLLPWWT